LRFHNENLDDPAPKNIRWLREKVSCRTTVPGTRNARIAAYEVPDNLGVPQKTVNVRCKATMFFFLDIIIEFLCINSVPHHAPGAVC